MSLVSFDMDGTLIRGTAALHMADRLGHRALADELEQGFFEGTVTARMFAETVAPYFAGLTVAEAERHLDDLPLIAGIAETVAVLGARGVGCIIATTSYAHHARYLCRRFGFADHCGAVMQEEDGVLLGRMAAHCDGEAKRQFVERAAAARGLTMNEVIHVGDSVSDLPLFAAVGHAVALNATPPARAAAHHCVDTENLADLLPLLGPLLVRRDRSA